METIVCRPRHKKDRPSPLGSQHEPQQSNLSLIAPTEKNKKKCLRVPWRGHRVRTQARPPAANRLPAASSPLQQKVNAAVCLVRVYAIRAAMPRIRQLGPIQQRGIKLLGDTFGRKKTGKCDSHEHNGRMLRPIHAGLGLTAYKIQAPYPPPASRRLALLA